MDKFNDRMYDVENKVDEIPEKGGGIDIEALVGKVNSLDEEVRKLKQSQQNVNKADGVAVGTDGEGA